MIAIMKSPKQVKYAPAKDGDAYCKILKDPRIMHPALMFDRSAKWHNPDGEYCEIEIYPDDQWYLRTINAGRLVKAKKTTTQKAPSTEEK